MFSKILRDVELVDALLPSSAALVVSGRSRRDPRGRLADPRAQRRVLEAALRHAIDFQTWRSLTTDGHITRAEAVELAVALVAAASVRTG